MSKQLKWHKVGKFRKGVIVIDHRHEGDVKDAADRWLEKHDKGKPPIAKPKPAR